MTVRVVDAMKLAEELTEMVTRRRAETLVADVVAYVWSVSAHSASSAGGVDWR